jgi:hypothetical protein
MPHSGTGGEDGAESTFAPSTHLEVESKQKQIWRSPEQIVEIAFQRASVVMMNEAHNGWKRCIRTREIGQRILPVAHQAGVRHLAVEALYLPAVAEQCNLSRQVPDHASGYLSQPEMREFLQTALDFGWTLISYEADGIQWLSARYKLETFDPNDPQEVQRILQMYQSEIASIEFTNWREEEQARNLIKALKSLPTNTPLLVWCGNSHQSRRPMPDWIPMGFQFKKLSGIDPFIIDQTRTVKFTDDLYRSRLVRKFAWDLAAHGETAGFLLEEAPSMFRHNTDADAFLLSTMNELE